MRKRSNMRREDRIAPYYTSTPSQARLSRDEYPKNVSMQQVNSCCRNGSKYTHRSTSNHTERGNAQQRNERPLMMYIRSNSSSCACILPQKQAIGIDVLQKENPQKPHISVKSKAESQSQSRPIPLINFAPLYPSPPLSRSQHE